MWGKLATVLVSANGDCLLAPIRAAPTPFAESKTSSNTANICFRRFFSL
jgi:hypothetical protein